MKSLTYFSINNVKFNYTLEFQNTYKKDYWKQNAPLIEYCETVGVEIPHYCYHKNLSISGNCRMCLVELKNAPKPIVSCAMSAKSCLNNSEIFTNSPLVKKARENVLEFLLLNHPLDCPICDQGGECDLQDQSFFFGVSKKRFYNFKRVVTDKNIGPIVKTVMTRCIHCTRCVRFSCEIAGTEDLGMFGRGLDSEVGTYVTKNFQSELSGNVIDLCPVGALTSKPYPFVSRSWELKNVNSIDFSDGFCVPTQIFLKNNKIIKVTPNYNNETNSWISDKTRFSFDGLFSADRVLQGFFVNSKNKFNYYNNWKSIINDILIGFYFQDHLNKHFVKQRTLTIVFDNTYNIEVIKLLSLLSAKYSFIKLRKSENNLVNTDLESSFISEQHDNFNELLNNSTKCLLVGFNSRYESSTLNTKLRSRYLKGDFEVFSVSSSIDLTFPVSYLNLTTDKLKRIAEGNDKFCQTIIGSKTLILTSSNIYSRKDSSGLYQYLNFITSKLKKYNHKFTNIKTINLSINETGIKYINNFKSFSENDLKNSLGIYFLNNNVNNLNIEKILNIKLLNYKFKDTLPSFCLEQNTGKFASTNKILRKSLKISEYINLPNNSFYESKGSFLNTEGHFKKTVKFVNLNNQTKDDWQIIRKLFFLMSKVNFLSTVSSNFKINFNCTTLKKFNLFTNFLFLASKCLTEKVNITVNSKVSNKFYSLPENNILKNSRKKIIKSKLKIWLNDFYIGGKDFYSKHSNTMINCSKISRSEKLTFISIK